MYVRVEVSLQSTGLLACARGGRLSVLPILACLMDVFDLQTSLLCRALSVQVLLPFSYLFFSLSVELAEIPSTFVVFEEYLLHFQGFARFGRNFVQGSLHWQIETSSMMTRFW